MFVTGIALLARDKMRERAEKAEAALAEWEKLKDPVTLHINLLRGFPATLTADMLRHIAGDFSDARAAVDAGALVEAVKQAIFAIPDAHLVSRDIIIHSVQAVIESHLTQ